MLARRLQSLVLCFDEGIDGSRILKYEIEAQNTQHHYQRSSHEDFYTHLEPCKNLVCYRVEYRFDAHRYTHTKMHVFESIVLTCLVLILVPYFLNKIYISV